MPTTSLSRRDLAFLVVAIGFALACFAASLYWLGAGIVCAGLVLARRAGQHRLGRALAVFGLLYLIVVFGYGAGRDMARRDNTRTVADGAHAP